jgi:hypothetical protein
VNPNGLESTETRRPSPHFSGEGTRNPNLAVVCDADQIIHAQIDKQHRNKVTYTCGSIENPEMNKFSITVLEGTRPAFDQRDSKYQA